jgi:hypothetical protein
MKVFSYVAQFHILGKTSSNFLRCMFFSILEPVHQLGQFRGIPELRISIGRGVSVLLDCFPSKIIIEILYP